MNMTVAFAITLMAEYERMEKYFREHAPMEYQAFKNSSLEPQKPEINIYDLEGRN